MNRMLIIAAVSVMCLATIAGIAWEEESDGAGYLSKEHHGMRKAKVSSSLPLTDCFVAPCVESCPIAQDIPDYIALAGEGRWAEALGLIYLKNALPGITGWICDNQ